MEFSKEICLIIDAFSTGKYLAPAFTLQGYHCIHIQSSTNLPPCYKHNDADFIENIVYQQDFKQLLTALARYSDSIKWSIAGSESGVLLANLLARQFGLVGNNIEYCVGYRDKNIMNKLVKEAGLKVSAQIKSSQIEEILQWSAPLEKPVVIKPVDSANGDGVFFCFDEDQIQVAVNELLHTTNQFGDKNTEVICEAFNDGQEYIVNTVSWAGQTCFAEIWRITRRPYTTIYDKAELVGSSDEAWTDITEYTLNVLKALKIEYGAATTELKYTRIKGAQLLETSNRLMSGAPLSLTQEALGFNQLSLFLEACLDREKFNSRLEHSRSLEPRKCATIVVLISNVAGALTQDLDTSFLTQLKTINNYTIKGEKGTVLEITKDSLSSLGEICLLSDNQIEINADIARIRAWESTAYQKALLPNQNLFTDNPISAPTFFVESSETSLDDSLPADLTQGTESRAKP